MRPLQVLHKYIHCFLSLPWASYTELKSKLLCLSQHLAVYVQKYRPLSQTQTDFFPPPKKHSSRYYCEADKAVFLSGFKAEIHTSLLWYTWLTLSTCQPGFKENTWSHLLGDLKAQTRNGRPSVPRPGKKLMTGAVFALLPSTSHSAACLFLHSFPLFIQAKARSLCYSIRKIPFCLLMQCLYPMGEGGSHTVASLFGFKRCHTLLNNVIDLQVKAPESSSEIKRKQSREMP